MSSPDAATALARTAYKTFEPFHITSYFNPDLTQAGEDTGLDGHAFYVGSRGAPLGETAGSVVAATFYNFNPVLVERVWPKAVAAGLDKVSDRRWAALDKTLGDALGTLVDDPDLVEVGNRLRDLGDTLNFAGRPLSAAWHRFPRPDAPHLALWHSIAVLREWRGDGHLAALVDAQLDPLEAGVFHEARHLDPEIRRGGLGKQITQLTREWSDDEWAAAAERLASRGLLTLGDKETLTADGVALDEHIENRTDVMASAVWRDVEDAEELIARTRPFVKAVINAGILPGTKKKS